MRAPSRPARAAREDARVSEVDDGAPVLREDLGPVRRLTLNRSRSLNALSSELLDALGTELDAAASDDGVHVLILRGAGRAFCAGYDLNEDASGGAMDARAWHRVLEHDNERML